MKQVGKIMSSVGFKQDMISKIEEPIEESIEEPIEESIIESIEDEESITEDLNDIIIEYLDELNIDELKELADEQEIKIKSSMKKAEIVSLLSKELEFE